MDDLRARLEAHLGDRYILDQELGSGGMATVFLATDTKHDRQVALKVLRPEVAAIGPERFLREIGTVARLAHPHILPLHDSGEAGGLLFYVMPFIEGESLRERLGREGALPIEDALQIVGECADALEYAHQAGIIHRDIKPGNILLSGGHAVIADFGIARAIESAADEDALTRAGVSIGTVGYMSPEQASGEMVVDSRSDVYALGCVLYEMLAGEPAFRGPTAQATLARQLEGPPSLRTVRPAAPHGLERVVERACRVIPMDRYRSAADFEKAVRATETDERVGRSAPARFGGVLLGGMMAVAVLWGGWAALQHGMSGSGAPDSGLSPQRVMIAALDNETCDPELDDLVKVAADWLAREVQRIEAVEVVDPRAILQASFSPGESGEGSQRDLAERLGAGTLVSGSYYLASDSIQFLTRIIDTGSGRLIQSVDPVAVPRQDPLLGLELLGARVLAATAALRSPDFSPGAEVLTHPQSYEAYRAYISAMESFSRLDFQSAFVHARRAETLDSTFHPSGLLVATIQFNMGHLAAMDSTLRALQANRARLTTVEGHILDSWQALLRGERVTAFRASRAAHSAAPTSPEIALLGAGHALFAGYLLTAAEMLRIPEMDQGPLRDWPPRWGWLLTSLHLLGNHGAELQAAREARNRLPDQHRWYEWEARALIGLGRLEEMERVREELLLLPPTASWSKGDVARELARELEAHGYEKEARALRREAIAWFEGRPDEDADQIEHRERHAWAHYDNGDWAAAREILVPLAEAEPENLRYIGMSGVIAAHEGKRAEARSIDQRLAAFETPYVRGSNTNWRASIAVALGERARAMELLRRAFGEGLSYNHWIHVDPAYKPLWGYPPFQALARPRD